MANRMTINVGSYHILEGTTNGYYGNGHLDKYYNFDGTVDTDFDNEDTIEVERNDNEHNWDDEEQEMIDQNLSRYHDRAFKI